MSEHTVSGVGTLDKCIRVLDVLAAHPASLADLVERSGLSRATTHRLATALEAHGLVRRDPDGRFALGLRLVALGRVAAAGLPLVEAAAPVVARLRDRTGESAQLYVRAGDQRVCVLSLESPHGLRTIVPLGAALPLDVGSAGRVLSGVESEPGWVASVAEREAGVASVSAPVLGPEGELRAAVSVSGPIERTSRRPGERYGPAVVAAAAEIESALRLPPPP